MAVKTPHSPVGPYTDWPTMRLSSTHSMIPCAFVLYPDNLKDSHPSEGAVYESTSPIAVPDAGSGKVLEFIAQK